MSSRNNKPADLNVSPLICVMKPIRGSRTATRNHLSLKRPMDQQTRLVILPNNQLGHCRTEVCVWKNYHEIANKMNFWNGLSEYIRMIESVLVERQYRVNRENDRRFQRSVRRDTYSNRSYQWYTVYSYRFSILCNVIYTLKNVFKYENNKKIL